MADTKSHPTGSAFIESDGINYRGIVVFMVILTVTTLACEGIVVGLFKYFDAQAKATATARAPLAVPAGTLPPPPNLITDEPGALKKFQTTENETLHTYGWVDKNAGVVRLPIDRAKELLLERGLPTAGETAAEPAKAQDAKAEIKK